MKALRSSCVIAVISLLCAVSVHAGVLDPTDGPGGTNSSMYTIDDVYNRLNDGTAGSPQIFTEPAAGPGSTMHNLNDIMGKAPAKDDTDGATAAQVMTGKKFWGLRTGGWGLLTGTMADRGAVTITPGTTDQTIAAGYHNGSGKVEGDTDLTGGNIMAGTTIFGIVGKCRKLPATGQTTCYGSGGTPISCTGTGQDGAYQYGCAPVVAPVSGNTPNRTSLPWKSSSGSGFIDNGDDTVTDTITGLMWQKATDDTTRTWAAALAYCNDLVLGGHSDWRLPNINELRSLVDPTQSPSLPSGHPFINVKSDFYWSST
jgi:hypothetical protein